MNHQAIDPSLRAAEPLLESLDDGFSPPADAQAHEDDDRGEADPGEPTLGPQSQF